MSEWIKWEGGECPVAREAKVEVRFRDGDTDTDYAEQYRWDVAPNTADIVAYRVIEEAPESETALKTQVGGDHYTKLKIQPMEYSMANDLNACQHTAIKYITRYKDKNGADDIRKAIHSLELLLEMEYGK